MVVFQNGDTDKHVIQCNIYIYMYIRTYKIMFSYILVGGIPTPLKNMSSSVGIIPT